MQHRTPLATVSALAAVLGAVLAPGGAARADVQLFARMTNDQETFPVVPTLTDGITPRPVSYGDAYFVLDTAGTSLRFTATVYNIDVTGAQTTDGNDDLRAAHIHAGPGVTPGTNGPVVWGFFGTPFNDNNPADIVLTPFAGGVGGTISGKWDAPEGNNTTLGAQIANLLSGRAYINFHTNQFPGGEIRGAITAVPEPGAVATGVVLGGALSLGLVRGRLRLRRLRDGGGAPGAAA